MGAYFGTTEITNFDCLIPVNGVDITQVFFATNEVFTVWAEYDGTLPAQYSANGDYLADYQLYGAAGGVGDDSGTAYGYVIPISVSDGTTSTTFPIYVGSDPLNANGEYVDYVDYQSQKIKRRIKTRIFNGSETFTPIPNKTGCYQLPINDHFNKSWNIPYSSNYYTWWQWIGNGTQYDAAPDKSLFGFVTYGLYVKDMDYLSSADFKNHIKELYDAGAPLAVTYVTREYYDTDPPVPFPVLPTDDGSTITDYAGQSAAPSRFYAKYRKEGY